jgi:microcystin-dependent protein
MVIEATSIGMILAFAGETISDGWLLCEGGQASQTRYRDLFKVVGHLYGDPIGNNIRGTFGLSDLRGRFPLGLDKDVGTIKQVAGAWQLAVWGGEDR